MERGILWLLLLAFFIWLAWQGKNEYQKVESYQNWATQFERAKYDIYAVIGQQGSDLTWGKPTTTGIINSETFSLQDVKAVNLIVDNQIVQVETPPNQGRKIVLEFVFLIGQNIRIPFTEISLAAQWGKYLQQEVQRLQLEQSA